MELKKHLYTVAEVKEAIEDEFDGYESEFYGEVGDTGYFLAKIGETATGVEREGGGEGQGEYMDVVFKINEQHFRMTGTYDSWNGSDWDGDLEEVEPYQELVTKYRRK